MRYFYLHGFASSPSSAKARFFAERLARHGVPLQCPDFNLPAFETLTVTRMLGQLDEAIDAGPAGPVVLIGSSLGGFAALHAADRRRHGGGQARPVARLVLLAPALDFPGDERMGTVVEPWREGGRHEVFHHAYGRPMQIAFGLYEDARRYSSSRVDLDVPILVFHGVNDDVVPPRVATEYASGRPSVTLRLLDDDHLLRNHLEEMWTESAAFLGLGRP